MSARHVVPGLLLTLLLVGCGRDLNSTPGDAPDLQRWVAEVRARPAPPLPALPVMQQFETFNYAVQGMRDPFAAAWNNGDGSSGPRPDPNRRKQPLEAFPLDGLDMVGSIGSGPALEALVMAPDKVTYRVRPGSYMGQNDGRVVQVAEDRIELVELVADGAGGWLERSAAMTLENQ